MESLVSFNNFFCAGQLSTYIFQVWTLMILALPNLIFSFLISNCFSCAELDRPGHLGGRPGAQRPFDRRRETPGPVARPASGAGRQHGQPVLHSRPQRPSSREGKLMDFFYLTVGW